MRWNRSPARTTPLPQPLSSPRRKLAGYFTAMAKMSVAAMGESESALDTAIGTGNIQITNDLLLTNLGYSVPAEVSNRGLGRSLFTPAAQGAIATDVAEG
ncbi:MAG: hypothetical protein OXQ89_11800 [Rhodospirillaceae bacterium]|nr:hypothetical protein [Rhodospirillaceae bacterium]